MARSQGFSGRGLEQGPNHQAGASGAGTLGSVQALRPPRRARSERGLTFERGRRLTEPPCSASAPLGKLIRAVGSTLGLRGRLLRQTQATKKAPKGAAGWNHTRLQSGWKSRSGKKRLNSIMIPAVSVNQMAANTGAVVRNFFMAMGGVVQ